MNEVQDSLCLGMSASVSHGIADVFLAQNGRGAFKLLHPMRLHVIWTMNQG